jgi:hypothetical protein
VGSFTARSFIAMGANCQIEKQAGGKMVIKAEATPMSACSSISVAEKDTKGMTNQKLLAAARDSDLEGLRNAIADGAYLETRRPFVMRPKPPVSGYEPSGGGKKRKTPKEGLTPLMYTTQNGSLEATKLLIEAKAQVQARDEEGLQPLHFAAGGGSLEVCSLLMSHGADKTAQTDDGRRPIEFVKDVDSKAAWKEWEALIGPQLLVAELKQPPPPQGQTTAASTAQRAEEAQEFVFAAAEAHAPNGTALTEPLQRQEAAKNALTTAQQQGTALVDLSPPSMPPVTTGSKHALESTTMQQPDLLCGDTNQWQVTNWPDPDVSAMAGGINVTPSVATAGA